MQFKVFISSVQAEFATERKMLAEPMYLNGTIERMGTGTRDIIQKCLNAGLKELTFYQEEFFRVVLCNQ